MDTYELYKQIDGKKITEFIHDGKEENLYLDFKTISKADLSNREDRKNFAKALSGFSNSNGGIIIWGVDARKNAQNIDCACGTNEIDSISLFLSKLNEYTGQFVCPLLDGVVHKKIVTSNDMGFAVTYVPYSDIGPHMAKAGEDRYYKRSGDSFYKMEHFDIEDMFGRRKKPKLKLYIDTSCSKFSDDSSCKQFNFCIIIGMENLGRGSCKYPYLELNISPPYQINHWGLNANGANGLPIIPQRLGNRKTLFGGDAHTVIHPNSKLDVTRITFEINSDNTNIKDLVIEAIMSAEDMQYITERKILSAKDILNLTNQC